MVTYLASGEIDSVAPEPHWAHLAHGVRVCGACRIHPLANTTSCVRLAGGQVTGTAEFPGRARLALRIGTGGAGPSRGHPLAHTTRVVRLARGQVTGIAEFPGRARLALVVAGGCRDTCEACPDGTRRHLNALW